MQESIQKAEDKVLGVFVSLCRKHNNNMKMVWTEFNSYLESSGKTKVKKALREAADRMSVMSTKEAVKILKKVGFESRSRVEVVVTINIDGESVSVTMPNGKNHKLKSRDYATRILCAIVGSKGNEAFEYLQRVIGDKSTKSTFRKAAHEMSSF